MRHSFFAAASATLLWSAVLSLGCSDSDAPQSGSENLSSNTVDLTDFEFDGEVVAATATQASALILTQAFYFVGGLYPYDANARLDWITVASTKEITTESGEKRVAYHAKIPVAWPKRVARPATFDIVLPVKIDEAGQNAFYAKYGRTCLSPEAHGTTADTFWHDFDLTRGTCKLDDADVMRAKATVTLSPNNTRGVYPEYDRVYADNALNVVVVFGKDALGATSNSDNGIAEYNNFVSRVRAAIPEVKTTPENVSSTPGVATPEVTLEGNLAGGATVKVTAILIDSAGTAGYAFDKRFNELTATADVVSYSGHSGLSVNTRAVAEKGTISKGQYQIWFFDGCNSWAYLDQGLQERFAAINPDDPNGTKYLDVVGNVLPAYFGSLAPSNLAIVTALMDRAHPKTYNEIFQQFQAVQQVVVTGEEDNSYRP